MRKSDLTMLYALVSLILLIIFGTVVYSVLEGWTITEALYFTMGTLATVGSGTLVPSPEYRLFTAFFILACTTMALASIAAIGNWIVSRIQLRSAIRKVHEEAIRIHEAMDVLGKEKDGFHDDVSKMSDDLEDVIKKI